MDENTNLIKFLETYDSYFIKYKDKNHLKKSNEKGWIYMFLTSFYNNKNMTINLPENTYKIGKTDSTIYLRFSTYNNIVDMKDIHTIKCSFPDQRELILKKYIKFKAGINPVSGQEYFSNCKNFLKTLILIIIFIKEEIITKVDSDIIINKIEEIINIIKTTGIFDLNNIQFENYNIQLINIDNKYVCKYCKNKFKNISSLNYHIKTNEKCISQRSDINNHYLSECEYCFKKFTQKDHLINHLSSCKKKDKNTINKLNNQIDKMNDIIKDKDQIIKNFINNSSSKLSNINDENINNKYEEMKAEKINKLIPYTNENIINIVDKIKYKNNLYYYDNFLFEFINIISLMTIGIDSNKNKLLIKNKNNESELILCDTYIKVILDISSTILLEIINSSILYLESTFFNETSYKIASKSIIKSWKNFEKLKKILTNNVTNSETITSILSNIKNLLYKNIDMLPSISEFKNINNTKLVKKIKKVRKVKNTDSDSESD